MSVLISHMDLPKKSHLEPMKGTFLQNDKYCSKDGLLVHFGERPVQQGARADRNEIYKLLKNNAMPLELMDHDFARYCRFQRGIQEYYSLKPPVRTTPLEVHLFYGPPGTGKTELALSQFPDSYRLPIGKNFWLTPAALRAKHIVIDDFKSNIQLCDFLQLLDAYPLEAERKGAHLWWCPETIIISSNRSIHDWYDYNTRDFEKEALLRRFHFCWRFEKNSDKVPRPIEIDIHDIRSFTAPIPPPIPHLMLDVNTYFMPQRTDKMWCIRHALKPCDCPIHYLTEDDDFNAQEAYKAKWGTHHLKDGGHEDPVTINDPNDLPTYNDPIELIDDDQSSTDEWMSRNAGNVLKWSSDEECSSDLMLL